MRCQKLDKFTKLKELLTSTTIKSDASSDEFERLMAPIRVELDSLRPKQLFRYRSCNENNFDALLSDRVYFSIPENFNDPYDCLVYIDEKAYSQLRSQIDKVSIIIEHLSKTRYDINTLVSNISPNELSQIEAVKSFLKSMSNEDITNFISILKTDATVEHVKRCFDMLTQKNRSENLKRVLQKTYIACLSEVFDSTLMWAHYADYHKGFVLSYAMDDLLYESTKCLACKDKCTHEHTISVYPVLYGSERYDATEHEVETMKVRLNYWCGIKSPYYIPDQLYFMKSVIFKGVDWDYEREWRLIYSSLNSDENFQYMIVKPSAIYLGSRISESNKRIILKLIEGKALPVYQMLADPNGKNFSLDSVPIES